MSEDKYRELRFLVGEAAEGLISNERMALLNHILLADADARRYYQEYILNNVILSTVYGNEGGSCKPVSGNNSEARQKYILKLAEIEEIAPEVEVDKGKTVVEEVKSVKVAKPRNKIFLLFDKLIYAAAVLFISFIIYAEMFLPDHSVAVATLIDQVNVAWGGDSASLNNNARLLTNQAPYSLSKGIVKIKYDQGVDVLIEGPAEFVIERNGIYVEEGRIYSLVSNVGRGFTIDTDSARFIDLGTEFGVEVLRSGVSELHVITGKVQLFAGEDNQEKVSRLVMQNEAVKYEAAKKALSSIPVMAQAFVRDIDSDVDFIWHGQKSVDLADYVGGGNGFGTGNLNYGIMIDSGLLSTIPLFVKEYNDHPQVKDNYFRPVPEVGAVDGIFIPDGGTGKVIVSSQGDVFNDCPDTNGRYCVPIINGAHYDKDLDVKFQIDNHDYGTDDSAGLFLHANIGITYDLNNIRKQLPERLSLTRFVSLASSPDNPSGKQRNLDVWVLLDGSLVFSKIGVSTDESFNIDIPLTSENRFLSLVVTQGGNLPGSGFETDDSWDWLLFGRPELTIEEQ